MAPTTPLVAMGGRWADAGCEGVGSGSQRGAGGSCVHPSFKSECWVRAGGGGNAELISVS